MNSLFIRAKNLSVGYEEKLVLDNISFDIQENKTTALMGPSGNGKSTLLKAIAKYSDDNNETLWTKGTLTTPEIKPYFMIQKTQAPGLTLYKYLEQLFDDPYKELRDFWECAGYAFQALKYEFDTPFDDLPLRIRRIAEFIAAVKSEYSFLILDEPDASCNDASLVWIINKLKELKGKRTIIICTHNLIIGKEISDNVILIVGGKIIEAANTDEFYNNPQQERTKIYLRSGT